jgi:hypothetical protein
MIGDSVKRRRTLTPQNQYRSIAYDADRRPDPTPIHTRTWRDFEFALPLSMDAILFTLLGFIVSLALTSAAAFGFTRIQEP